MAKKKRQSEYEDTKDEKVTAKPGLREGEVSKSDIEGFPGGLKVNLGRVMEDGTTLREKLSAHLVETLDTEIKNFEQRQAKIQKWNDNYTGVRPPKNVPFEGASNVAHPLTRSNVDTIFVRIMDVIFNKRKVLIIRAKQPDLVDMARQIEDAMDHFLRNVLRLREKIVAPLLQCVKIGTGIVKLVNESKKRVVYRYATDDELKDKGIKKYDLQGTTARGIKYVETVYDGPNLYPVLREDFIISADSDTIPDAYLVGMRLYQRKAQLELKVRQGLYYKSAVKRIVSPDEFDDVKQAKADGQKKSLDKTEYEHPYETWELWTKYDVDEDGEEDSVVATVHRASGQILSCIYNPIFYGFKPFTALKSYTLEGAFDGEGICEILEAIQATVDTLVNQYIDRVHQINAPITLYRPSAFPTDYAFRLTPGKAIPVDDNLEEAVRIIQFPEVLPSNDRMIDRLVADGDRACGITPAVMGISTAERPVAKETFALQQEANKKFKYLYDNVRMGLTEIGYQILEMMTQYQPQFTYKSDEGGQVQEKTVDFSLVGAIRENFEIDLECSSEILNQEARREVGLAVYQILTDYMTKIAGMAQALVSPQVPSDFKAVLLDAGQKSVKLLTRILQDFDQVDATSLILDLTKVVNVEKVMAMSIDNMPPQPPEGGDLPPGGPPQGGPPMGPSPEMGGGPPPMGPM